MTERLLLKTTIGPVADDWNIGRFSLLTQHLASVHDAKGAPLYAVVARDRVVNNSGDDVYIERAAAGDFDQLWLIATDVTGALTSGDAENVATFRKRGGGVFITRDHQDLGSCLAALGLLGRTQRFQSVNPEEDEARRQCDDLATPSITWPNYHSGANGDLQVIETVQPLHPLVRRSAGVPLVRLPAHPHEGAVDVPRELAVYGRVVARGRSLRTGAAFGLCAALEEPGLGRGVADSSFHHMADYNWNPRMGCPSFVDEPPGDQVMHDPEALADVHLYVANIAAWLGGTT